MNRKLTCFAVLTLLVTNLVSPANLKAQQQIDLTLESAVDIMMNNSYRIKQLIMGIERTRLLLKAERAGLKSKVYMNLETPDLNRTSDYKWNSTLQRNEIVRENSNRWQMDLAIKQPLILFGFPTNGNISMNYKIYRYSQSEDGDIFTNYYNRLYLKFEQPLFQPNELKNDIEEAELDLEEDELDYLSDRVEIIEDISDDYYALFRVVYKDQIINNHLENLKSIESITLEIVQLDTTRMIEKKQMELEIANVNDELMRNQSEIRLQKAYMIQRLRLHENDIINLTPDVQITQITVDQEEAVQYGYSLRPSMRLLAIDKRKEEIDFQYTKASDAAKLDLEMTYGLERDDERYRALWDNYDNSNSVTLNAYIPIWDWGRRRARIEAGKISMRKIDLSIEERQKDIRTRIINAINSHREYQQRVVNMQSSVEMAKDITQESIKQYKANEISLQDLLQIVTKERTTEDNFLVAYLDYRHAILSLMLNTYYDYENDISLIDAMRLKSGL